MMRGEVYPGGGVRQRGIAAMQDPDAGLAFTNEEVPQRRIPIWLRLCLLATGVALLRVFGFF